MKSHTEYGEREKKMSWLVVLHRFHQTILCISFHIGEMCVSLEVYKAVVERFPH